MAAHMTLLPVVERELRVASRRPATYWGRMAVGLLASTLGTYLFVLSEQFAWSELGTTLFLAFAWLAFLSCMLAGARHTATCISSERREGTLGLLFLTDLKGYDIVLGKLVASSVAALQGVLAILPILAIPLLLGGVTAAQFLRSVAVLLATLLYSLALGLCVSVWFDNDRRASAVTTLLLVTVTIGPWTAALLWFHWPWASLPGSLLLVSPAYALLLATTGAMPGSWLAPGGYGTALGLLVAQGLGLLVLTSSVLARMCQARAVSTRAGVWRGYAQEAWKRSAACQWRFRTKLLAVIWSY